MLSVTVIVPCWNAEQYLSQSLESAFAQSRKADQIIVVDDCSTDQSKAVASRYPVTLLATPQNRGHAAARNLGIAQASGDVIAWLDADDYWEPDHLEVVVGLLERFPEADVAYSGVRCFGTRSLSIVERYCVDFPKKLFWECFERTIVPATSAVTRTAAIRGVGGFDATYRISPDFDLWLRMASQSLFVCTDRITANYRAHPTQISSNYAAQLRSQFVARMRMLDQVRSKGDQRATQAMRDRILALWDNYLRYAWTLRDMESVDAYLEFATVIGCDTATSKRLRRRRLVPRQVIVTWDRVQEMARLASLRGLFQRS